MPTSILTGKEAPPRAKREPQSSPTDLEVFLSSLHRVVDGLKIESSEKVDALRSAVDTIVAEIHAEREAFHEAHLTELAELRASHASLLASMSARLEGEVAARVDSEKQKAELVGRLAKTEASLAFERARPAPPSPAPLAPVQQVVKFEPAEYKIDFKRGRDGRIREDSLVIRRIPKE